MLPAIGFDDQPALLAYEIGKERANWLLPAKLDAELAVSRR